jgi:hypothetical protein
MLPLWCRTTSTLLEEYLLHLSVIPQRRERTRDTVADQIFSKKLTTDEIGKALFSASPDKAAVLRCFAFSDRVDAGSGSVEAGVASRADTVTLRSWVRSRWNMQQAYCWTYFLAAKEAHTLDLCFRHGRHAASVCLRFVHLLCILVAFGGMKATDLASKLCLHDGHRDLSPVGNVKAWHIRSSVCFF